MLTLLLIGFASGQRTEACPNGYLPGTFHVIHEFGPGCYLEVIYCVQDPATIPAGQIPNIHVMEMTFVSDPADACDKVGFPIDGSGNPSIPWPEVLGQIIAEEPLIDDFLHNDIPECNDQDPVFTFVELTHGGCYSVNLIINELEVRRVLTPCDPTRMDKCEAYYKICKEWDQSVGWIVHVEESGVPVPLFNCDGVIDPNQEQCTPICD
jgi:hypothetical protein